MNKLAYNPLTGMTLNPRYLWIGIIPVLTVIIAECVLSISGDRPVIIGGDLIADSIKTAAMWSNEAAIRMKIFGILIVVVLYALAILVRFECERQKLFSSEMARDLLLLWIGLSMVPVIIVWLAARETLPPSFDILGQDVYKRAFEVSKTNAQYLNFPLTMERFWWMINGAGLIIGLAIAALVASGISCLGMIDDPDIDIQKAHWKYQSERLQLTVYLSTGLLVFGLLFLQSWGQWPTFALAVTDRKTPNAFLEAFNSISTSFVAFNGIEYSLLLASFVLPIAVFLNAQADNIARTSLIKKFQASVTPSAPPVGNLPKIFPAAIANERTAQKLFVPIIDQLKSIVAILVPFLAGSIGNISSLLSTKL